MFAERALRNRGAVATVDLEPGAGRLGRHARDLDRDLGPARDTRGDRDVVRCVHRNGVAAVLVAA